MFCFHENHHGRDCFLVNCIRPLILGRLYGIYAVRGVYGKGAVSLRILKLKPLSLGKFCHFKPILSPWYAGELLASLKKFLAKCSHVSWFQHMLSILDNQLNSLVDWCHQAPKTPPPPTPKQQQQQRQRFCSIFQTFAFYFHALQMTWGPSFCCQDRTRVVVPSIDGIDAEDLGDVIGRHPSVIIRAKDCRIYGCINIYIYIWMFFADSLTYWQ